MAKTIEGFNRTRLVTKNKTNVHPVQDWFYLGQDHVSLREGPGTTRNRTRFY